MQKYLLETLGKIYIDKENLSQKEANKDQANAFEANLVYCYGYVCSDELYDAISRLDNKKFKSLAKQIKPAHGEPLFKNFPETYPCNNAWELFFDAFFSGKETQVLSCGCEVTKDLQINRFNGCPICGQMFKKSEAFTPYKLDKNAANELLPVAQLATFEDIAELVKQKLRSPVRLSAEDLIFLNKFLVSQKNETIKLLLPERITLKETALTLAIGLSMQNEGKKEIVSAVLSKTSINVKDILRLAKGFSDRSGNLAEAINSKEKIKFRLKASQKKVLLDMLAGLNGSMQSIADTMRGNLDEWKRLLYAIHAGSKAGIVKSIADTAYNNLRGYNSFERALANVIGAKEIYCDELKSLFAWKPTIILRKIDYIVRNISDKVRASDIDEIFGSVEFQQALEKSTTKILLQVARLLDYRSENETTVRTYKPAGKNNTLRVESVSFSLEPLDKKIASRISADIKAVLNKRFSEQEAFKKGEKVYIGEALKTCVVPLTLNGISTGYKPLMRGTKIKLNDSTRFIRAFTYWKGDMVDLDLSAEFYNFSSLNDRHDVCSYTRLNSLDGAAVHSGDVRSAPNGAFEFIDIDLQGVKAKGLNKIFIINNSYSGEEFEKLDAFIGVMESENRDYAKHFDPLKVRIKHDLKGSSRLNVGFAIDLENREILVMDVNRYSKPCDNIHTLRKPIELTYLGIDAYLSTYPNLYELIKLHADACGAKIVDSVEDADIVCDFGAEISPYDNNVIIDRFLRDEAQVINK